MPASEGNAPQWNLAGRRVLVTGAGRGLGRGIAKAFAAAGAQVIAVARNAAELDSLAADTAGVTPWPFDITSLEFVERLRSLSQLDVLVNNAGTNQPEPMVDVTAATLDRMLNLNVRALYRTSQAAVAVMQAAGQGGSIIHMSSQMGHVGSPGRTVYCMTKHAVEGLTKAMAVELAADGIRVNSVAPTFVETELTRPMLEEPEFRDFVLARIPLGHLAQISDVVNAVLYLASPLAKATTGHSMRVDGGWTAQ